MRSLDRRTFAAFAIGAASPVLAPVPPRRALAQAAPSAEARLRERGIELPRVSAPVANYVPHVRTGNLVFLAGTGPTTPDGKFITGKVGKDTTVEEAYGHARLTGLMLRASVGSLDNVARAVKVLGMVNCTPEFTEHPKIINGCSDLFVEVFGDRGKHARSAVGMGSLPFGISVEIEAIFEVA
jgi:enamine deaminase RidA (YjgF/YER057c/UK114 family)